MSDNHFDNSDWHIGMELPSRKQTHKKKKKSTATPPKSEDPQPDPASVEEEQVARAELEQGTSEAAATLATAGDVTAAERDLLWGDEEEEDGPILTTWQRLLLFVLVPLVVLVVLVWGKIAYVHQVPDLVRSNVPAYASCEGYLVLKPWWFGPPIYKLDFYPPANDFPMYKIRMGDHAPLVEDPVVLWQFSKDLFN